MEIYRRCERQLGPIKFRPVDTQQLAISERDFKQSAVLNVCDTQVTHIEIAADKVATIKSGLAEITFCECALFKFYRGYLASGKINFFK